MNEQGENASQKIYSNLYTFSEVLKLDNETFRSIPLEYFDKPFRKNDIGKIETEIKRLFAPLSQKPIK